MYFTKVRIVGLFATIDLPVIGSRPSDPYIVKDIDGLGPPEIDLFMSDTINQDIGLKGRQPQNRQIDIRLGINPNYAAGQSVSDLTTPLYTFLTPGADFNAPNEIHIMDGDTVVAKTKGYFKRIGRVPFAKDPEIQLTMDCISPYLEAPDEIMVNTWDGSGFFKVTNPGNAPSPFRMRLLLSANAPGGLTISNGPYGMGFQYSFLQGDQIDFNTTPGARDAFLDRGGFESKIVHVLNAQTQWIQLHPGINPIGSNFPSISAAIVWFTPRYWGV